MRRILLLAMFLCASVQPAHPQDPVPVPQIRDGYEELQLGHFQKAAGIFSKIVAADPKNANARRYLAASLTNSGNARAALYEITAAQAIDGKKAYDELLLGDAYFALQNFSAARTHYAEARKGLSTETAASIALARLFVQQRHFDEARQICDGLSMKRLTQGEQNAVRSLLREMAPPEQAADPTPGNS